MRRRGTTNLDDIRRALRLGMGPCQGGFCIYRATGILHGLDGMTAEQAERGAASLPAGALEGHVADPLRRPAAPGAAGRLDLPGHPRRGAPAVVTRRAALRRVVIGAGTAGLAAAARLAEGGARRVRAGQGRRARRIWRPGRSTCSATRPSAWRSPARALERARRRATRPPLRAAWASRRVAPALRVVRRAHRAGPQPGYRYTGDLERNHLLPTAVGALRPSALVPETMAAGDMRARGPVCIVGTRVLRDFHAALCAANLAGRRRIAARAVEIEIERRARRRQRARPRAAVRRPRVPRRVRGAARPHARAATSAWGCRRCSACATRTARGPISQQRLGRGGLRDPDAAAVGAGHARLRGPAHGAARRAAAGSCSAPRWSAPSATASRHRGARHAARPRRPLPRALVRARHGRLRLGRRSTLGSDWVTRETALGLPLRGAPAPASRGSCASTSPSSRWRASGSRSTRALRAEGAENVLVAGAALPGAVPWREGSGEGIALASGHRAADGRLAEGAAEGDGMTRRRARGAPARLARPLREVHDLRDRVPGLQRRRRSSPGRSTRARRPSATASPTSPRSRRRSTTARAAASARRSARRA